MRFSSILGSLSLLALLAVGCGDDGGTGSEDDTGTAGTAETGTESGDGDGDPATGDGDGDGDPTGDGDGDPTGDGDGDPTGDGDGDMSGDGDGDMSGDGDGDMSGDGDGDMMCSIGAEGCPCTGGGGCDPGLECMDDICSIPPEEPPYAPCPSGEDDECGQDQVCATGESQGVAWSLCTDPCDAPDQCAYDDVDACADLPGDGELMGWCTPVVDCDFGNPCPDGMQCIAGFQNNPNVCVWPDE